MKALLALEDGTVLEGAACGAEGETAGEMVFNTSMTGYQEILTDPSYAGQIITMTYPQIGNYGVNEDDVESRRPFAEGFVMRECCWEPSNWRATKSLPDYLRENGIVAIEGVDTRRVTKLLRTEGALKAVVSTGDLDPESLVAKARALPDMYGSDFVKDVTAPERYEWPTEGGERYHVVAFDYGIKRNILRMLARHGCRVTVVPATTPAEDVLALDPDGVFLSNGPGDPGACSYLLPAIQELADKKPLFGICLGHQLLGLALGGERFKLKFGHHGGNQPVMNHETGRVEISAQNHGFGIDPDSLPDDVRVTHVNLNDHSVEGLVHKELPVFSIQYHPEAAPGPHDSRYLFERFVGAMEARRP